MVGFDRDIQAWIPAGSTPEIKKVLGGAVALSPTALYVAETGEIDDQDYLRISNYQTGEAVGQKPVAFKAHTLAFSPDGKLLLALPGGKGSWGRIQIYAEPWDQARIVFDQEALHSLYHAAWLDSQTVLLAGSAEYGVMSIAVLDVEKGRVKTLLRKKPRAGKEFGSDHLDSAACSPSGAIVFSIGSGRTAMLFQVDEKRKKITPGLVFPVNYLGYTMETAISDDGQTIFFYCSSSSRPFAAVYNAQGQPVMQIKQPADAGILKQGILCFTEGSRGGATGTLYRVTADGLSLWCSDDLPPSHMHSVPDLLAGPDGALVAVEEEDRTTVYEIKDADLIQLYSEDAAQRRNAAESLGRRRYNPAVRELAGLVSDRDVFVQEAAARALASIRDPAGLPAVIRALGRTHSRETASVFLDAVQEFPLETLSTAVLESLANPASAYRRGAVQVLTAVPQIEALDALCAAVHDTDAEIRLGSARALERRADLRACPALLARLNDADEPVRLAVQSALLQTFRAQGLGSAGMLDELDAPLDVDAYVEEVIAAGRMGDFVHFSDPRLGFFLHGLGLACAKSSQALPAFLNALEALSAESKALDPASARVGLLVALACADGLRSEREWQPAGHLYRQAAALAQKSQAPGIEWRAWLALGECREGLGEDQAALRAFQNAMEVIDRLWYALLEEDKLRHFFQDKALLYDHAGLCCLRLGYNAQALECLEKAKTRYLGDLIARRQMPPETVLDAELRSFWRALDHARPVRLAVSSSGQAAGSSAMEIVGVELGSDDEATSGPVYLPQHLAAYRAARQTDAGLRSLSYMVDAVWQLAVVAANLEDERVQQSLEEVYETLLPVYQAASSGMLPMPASQQSDLFERYRSAAYAVLEVGNRNPPFWAFSEPGTYWLEEICNLTRNDPQILVLNAVMEGLNVVLHHEAVLSVPWEGDGAGEEVSRSGGVRLKVVTRGDSPGVSRPGETVTVQSALEQVSQTRWRYVTQLARGEISTFQQISTEMPADDRAAVLQFAVSAQGTVTYAIFHDGSTAQPGALMPALRGEQNLHVYTCAEVNLSSLQERLLDRPDSWFARYAARSARADGLRLWQASMDSVLEWLYEKLIAPLLPDLRQRRIRRLHIIPHRGLHLIPFSALYQSQPGGGRNYLLDRFEISYAPSATLQHICRERMREREFDNGLTAVANPTSDLPFSDAEVDDLARYFRSQPVNVLRGSAARVSRVTAEAPRGFFHFSGHASYRWDDPLASCLFFSGPDRLSLDALFGEAVSLPRTGRVVLSACETSVSDPRDLADEFLGLAAGFLFAGTPVVVSTLWAVSDLSSALLVSKFYENWLKKKQPASRALRSAQRWLRDEATRPVVIETVEKMLDRLEARLDEATQWSQEGENLTRLVRLLNDRRQALLADEAARPGERPFVHPFYWAAFTVAGSWVEVKMDADES